jgi:2-polyprenyl-3-methyl-5-hydroxy-6-metoxy-1,4-benzoquinol methylase
VPELITDAYRQEQIRLHAASHGYAGNGDQWLPAVQAVIARYLPKSVLDYGAGQGALAGALRAHYQALDIREYDPAVEGKAAMPASADVVVCTDVLEHIEPNCLSGVLDHLHSLVQVALFVVIATRPSDKRLSDGRNAHLIIDNAAWWAEQLRAHGFTGRTPPFNVTPSPLEWIAVLTRRA